MSATDVELKFEAVVIPVADSDRSKEFYGRLGWRLDADFGFDNGFRVVQFTPPGSGCSVQFGTKITAATPGSAQGLYLIVSDIEAARAQLAERGAEVSGVFHPGSPGAQFEPGGGDGRVSGRAPDGQSYSSFATFSDPDGNTWLLQEITTRLPGRVDSARRLTPRCRTWPARCGGRRPRTASTRSASGRPTRTGPTGTPRTWSRRRRERNCRRERGVRVSGIAPDRREDPACGASGGCLDIVVDPDGGGQPVGTTAFHASHPAPPGPAVSRAASPR